MEGGGKREGKSSGITQLSFGVREEAHVLP